MSECVRLSDLSLVRCRKWMDRYRMRATKVHTVSEDLHVRLNAISSTYAEGYELSCA